MRSYKVVIPALAAIFISSCGGGSSSTPTVSNQSNEYSLEQLDSIGKNYTPSIGNYGGVMNLALDSDPDGFCPALTNSGYSRKIMSYIYEGLVTLNAATLEYEPNLAESWTVSDDGLEWVFTLKQDVLFSDSVNFTADDVIFTFNDIIYNEKLNSPLNYLFRVDGEKIDVSKVDKYTIKFTLPKPFAPFLGSAGISIMPKHKYESAALDGSLESSLSNGAAPEDVVGTGPFRLKKVELGERIVLERNPLYRKFDAEGNRLPYLDEVNLLIIKEPNIQMLKFKDGEIDQLVVQGEHYPMLKPNEQLHNIRLYRVGPRWFNSFFQFNQNNQVNSEGVPFLDPKKQEWFRTKEFRQAAAYVVDYNEIINIAYNGLAQPPGGVWEPHKGKFNSPDARLYEYNPAKADSLYSSIGMIDRDGDGFREDSTGAPVEFTLSTSAGMKLIEDIYSIVRKDFEAAGIKVHLQFLEFNTLIDKTTDTYDWDVVAYASGGIIDPHGSMSNMSSNSQRYQINPQRFDTNGDPIEKYDRDFEERINEIFIEAASEMDDAKRIELYQEWQNIYQEQALSIYMPLKEVILGQQNKFGNIHLTANLALIGTLFHNTEEIYILPESE